MKHEWSIEGMKLLGVIQNFIYENGGNENLAEIIMDENPDIFPGKAFRHRRQRDKTELHLLKTA